MNIFKAGMTMRNDNIEALAEESLYPKCHFVFLLNWKTKAETLHLDFFRYFNKKDEIQIIDYHFHV